MVNEKNNLNKMYNENKSDRVCHIQTKYILDFNKTNLYLNHIVKRISSENV